MLDVIIPHVITQYLTNMWYQHIKRWHYYTSWGLRRGRQDARNVGNARKTVSGPNSSARIFIWVFSLALCRSQYRSVVMVTGLTDWTTAESWFDFQHGQRFLFSHKLSHRVWIPSGLLFNGCRLLSPLVHSCQQKSIGLKFSKSQTGSDVRESCHHNSSRFTFPIFAHSCRFSVLHLLQSITPRIY